MPIRKPDAGSSHGILLWNVVHCLIFITGHARMLKQSQEQPEYEISSFSPAALLDNLPGMAYRCRNDPFWTMEFVSQGCLSLTGYQPNDLIGNRKHAYADLIHPDDRDQVWDAIQTAFETNDRFQVTYRIHTAAGEEKWVWEQGCGIHDPHGHVTAIEGLITDAPRQVQAIQAFEEQISDRNSELTTLLEIARNVAATLELEPLLGLILDEVQAAVEYHGAGILIAQDGMLVQHAARGPIPERIAEGIRMPIIASSGPVWQVLDTATPVVIDDVWADDPMASKYREAVSEEWLRARPYIRSWVGVPLQIRQQMLGLMVITYSEPRHFTDHHVRLLAAVAAQASVAIENARLVSAARETAVLEERQRLARDLHDAVTQTLFSASLVGDVLPMLWTRDQKRGEEALQDLRLLTRGALAEMRTLLFELRPTALTETPLGDLLRHLADSVTGRTRMPTTVMVRDVQTLPPEVQIAFYRIAQEALNNIVKHAEASSVDLRLVGAPDGCVQLHVHDDGHGFNPSDRPVGHFGMETMRERATAIGAELTISSTADSGTDVLLVWSADRKVRKSDTSAEVT